MQKYDKWFDARKTNLSLNSLSTAITKTAGRVRDARVFLICMVFKRKLPFHLL